MASKKIYKNIDGLLSLLTSIYELFSKILGCEVYFNHFIQTMTNAPKWSRDLTKLMNPKCDNDWRLLASRLGYTNDDIRGWATQHDPCMALLSEWYATHKTSEASFGVLNALTEMNRMDGAAIVENAMKQAGEFVNCYSTGITQTIGKC